MKSELPSREEVKEALVVLEQWCAAMGHANEPDGVVEKVLKAYTQGELIPASRYCHRCGQILSDKKSSPVDLRGGERNG